MRLDGQVAVVTGGASGIGAAVVEHLAAAGARPVVWDRQAAGSGSVVCDVRDPAAVSAALDRTLADAGLPTVLVTAAGIGGGLSPIVDLAPEVWDEVLAVNLRGTMLCVRAVAQRLRAAGRGGSIVTVASINGHVPDRGMAAYCVSKAGVEMLTRVAAAELGADGIRVNAVAPGVTETPLSAAMPAVPGLVERITEHTPLGGMGSADQIAAAVMTLLSAEWVTGQVLTADGGLTLQSPVDTFGAVARLQAGGGASAGG